MMTRMSRLCILGSLAALICVGWSLPARAESKTEGKAVRRVKGFANDNKNGIKYRASTLSNLFKKGSLYEARMVERGPNGKKISTPKNQTWKIRMRADNQRSLREMGQKKGPEVEYGIQAKNSRTTNTFRTKVLWKTTYDKKGNVTAFKTGSANYRVEQGRHGTQVTAARQDHKRYAPITLPGGGALRVAPPRGGRR